MIKIGIIGGSGVDDPKILKDAKEIKFNTPFGEPSSALTTGKIGKVDVVILARHGKRHQISPSQVNYRANIHALKEQGCNYIIATSAVGSLKEEIERGDFIFLDQFIDFTRHRKFSFYESFENGIKHTPMAEPFDKLLREKLIESARELKLKHHEKGTVVTIEGPRFSTKAESNMFRLIGADVINMSIASEVILANEAGIPYAAIAMSTDYDCWWPSEETVSWEMIMNVMNKNADNVKKLILHTISKL